jgi:hypothetical protein
MKTSSLARLPVRCWKKGTTLASLLTLAFLLSANNWAKWKHYGRKNS